MMIMFMLCVNEYAINKATCAETRRARLHKCNTFAMQTTCFMTIDLKYVRT